MLKKCVTDNLEQLLEYLNNEKEYNTFLIADINNYGFESDCQDVWMDVEGEECKGVYLRFYSNLLVYSKEASLNIEIMQDILSEYEIAVIMGKSSLLAPIEDEIGYFGGGSKHLYRLADEEKLKPENQDIIQAEITDTDEIFEFLASIPEIRALYTSKDMIHDRIANHDGVHLFIRKDGKIISHGNTTSSSGATVILGGIATAPEFTRQGYAASVTSQLAREVLSLGAVPCLFADESVHEFYDKLGFESLGGWSTLVKK